MVRTLVGKHPLYYEAILQLRDVLPAVEQFVFESLRKTGVPITKIKKIKNGIDIYLADKKIAQSVGKQLQERFGGEYRVSMSIFGKKDGKTLYRITILFRGLPFEKKQSVLYKGEHYLVAMLGKDILLQQEATGKKVHVKYRDAKMVKIQKV